MTGRNQRWLLQSRHTVRNHLCLIMCTYALSAQRYRGTFKWHAIVY